MFAFEYGSKQFNLWKIDKRVNPNNAFKTIFPPKGEIVLVHSVYHFTNHLFLYSVSVASLNIRQIFSQSWQLLRFKTLG